MPFAATDKILFPTDRPDWISFEFGAPGPDLLPSNLIKESVNDRLDRPDAHLSLQYGPSLGDLEFREQLAEFLTAQYRDKVHPTRLAITNGASQSFSK
jgi:DNA-binding transcriptional MocR family regulator